jgi:uncharacterized protein YraI
MVESFLRANATSATRQRKDFEMLKTLTLAALVSTGVILSTVAAFAAPAEAISAVNVRDEGSIDGDIVDVLSAGEEVEVTECEGGWCFIIHSGPDGWVSANYLTAPGDEDEVEESQEEDADEDYGDEDEDEDEDYGDDEVESIYDL